MDNDYDHLDEWEIKLKEKWDKVLELRDDQLREILSILKLLKVYITERDDICKNELFTYISTQMRDGIGTEMIWRWIYNLTQEIPDLCYDQTFIIGLTEPATEKPVDITDLHGYMQRINESRSFADLIFESYNREGFPENIISDYVFYSKWRAENYSSAPPFPFGWLQEYIDQQQE